MLRVLPTRCWRMKCTMRWISASSGIALFVIQNTLKQTNLINRSCKGLIQVERGCQLLNTSFNALWATKSHDVKAAVSGWHLNDIRCFTRRADSCNFAFTGDITSATSLYFLLTQHLTFPIKLWLGRLLSLGIKPLASQALVALRSSNLEWLWNTAAKAEQQKGVAESRKMPRASSTPAPGLSPQFCFNERVLRGMSCALRRFCSVTKQQSQNLPVCARIENRLPKPFQIHDR